MMHSRVHIRLLAACFAFSSLAATAGQPIPAEVLARTPAIQSVSMSTDGKNLVTLVVAPGSKDGDTALASWDLDHIDAGSRITPSGDRMKFVAASALKADRILVIARQEWTGQLGGCGEGKRTGATKTFVFKTYLTDGSHKKFDEAFAAKSSKIDMPEDMRRCLELAGTASLVNPLPLDPDNVIIRQLDPGSMVSNYLLYNLRSGESRLLFKGGGRSEPGLFDPRTGELLTRTQLEPVGGGEYEQQVLIRDPESNQFVVHPNLTRKLSERYTVDIVGRDERSGKFYVLTDLFSDKVQAWLYDPATRTFEDEPLLAHPKYSISRLIFGRQPSDFGRILGFAVDGPQVEVTYIDPRMQAIQALLEKNFPAQSVMITGYDDGLGKVLFTTSSHRDPPAYHLLLDRKRIVSLGSRLPSFKPEWVGEQRWVEYRARDGMTIPAILDLPAGWTPAQGPLPAIVHPHGGPWSRDYMGWDVSGWVPFLTSRGYAVLRPQYRGSTGLGRALWLAGDAEWGQKMQDDLDDGATWLVQQGIADTRREAIFGYSYGGFAAAAAVVRPNGPFQCAIAGAPVTDLAKLGWSWSENRLQRILQGRTVKGMDPMQNTEKASIPVLLFVGDRDVRTPAFHAEGFYKAVKDKVPAKFALVPDMPHSMPWYPRQQLQTLGLIEAFLEHDCNRKG